MSVLTAHVHYRVLEYVRTPIAIGSTLGFPTMLTLLFLLPNLPSEAAPRGVAIILLLAFAMVGIFNLGAGISQERSTPWEVFLRTLPLRPSTALGANVAVALGFAVIGALPAIGLLAWRLDLALPMTRVPPLTGAVLLGALAMAGLGLTIGYALPPKAAVAAANLVFTPMAFIGGLFLPPELLPGWAAIVGWATPMRPWVETSFAAATGTPMSIWPWLALAAWAGFLWTLAAWAYRRDQVRRYS